MAMNVARGACRDVDPALLDPEPGDLVAESAAKQLCKACVIRMECLSVAFHTQHLSGIWGGLTAAERARHARAEEDGPTRQR